MLSSLFDSRPRRKNRRIDRSPLASSYTRTATPPRSRTHFNGRQKHSYQDVSVSQSESSSVEQASTDDASDRESQQEGTDEDANNEEVSSLLPLFNSAHLDALPIYALTHTIRLVVEAKCDTVLTWEQLRSPQVSQFLVKPIEQQIKSSHFSAATMYCLMANCLQFVKEIDMYPANSGTIRTRSMVCELLAVKMLKEHTSRGLIDALSYDFNPLQGQSDFVPSMPDHRASWQSTSRRIKPRSVRISCLEIAIRAQAKRFLAHPMVVQQLESIWDGSIVFHAAADSLHRRNPFEHTMYGTVYSPIGQSEVRTQTSSTTRKIVTLYNPRDASIFKLSRLRVPRYRNILSTLSFAVLLGLFIAVLVQRSIHITLLEIIFWFWAAGYMMDELVGFSEQGFGLYLASFWNTIDLGIVVVLLIHLVLRVFGIVMPDIQRRSIANTAFDILAADAILLFPRLFSVLDHYRYFSQLIIAFRMMMADFIAVFVLIGIACSGFFVALTLSFGYDGTDSAPEVAYALLQMILGFTPAVWDRWPSYTPLGRFILVLFLSICHFLILTILITVLTNSFMAVVKNANEEHQFIFAINTISSVKSDSLFSYVPPLNVLQWTLTPLRYVVPFRQYIKINRTVIKVTHFPVLFCIYVYEKVILQSIVVESIDMVERRRAVNSAATDRLRRMGRESTRGNIRQDQALEEVFRQPFDATMRTEAINTRKSSNVVDKWMYDMGEGNANPPQEDDPKTVDKLEKRRLGERSLSTFSRARRKSRTLSVASDPADQASHGGFFSELTGVVSATVPSSSRIDRYNDDDTADGDDELQTNNNDDDDDRMTTNSRTINMQRPLQNTDDSINFQSPLTRSSFAASAQSSSYQNHTSSSGRGSPSGIIMRGRPGTHMRTVSSATVILKPLLKDNTNEEIIHETTSVPTRPVTPGSKQTSSGGKKTPKPVYPPRLRPIFPDKDNQVFRSAPNLKGVLQQQSPRRSSLEVDLISDIGDNKAIGGGYVGAIPASFAAQMASGVILQQQERKEEQQMFGRLMMARMNTLEEGFREVVHEMRESNKSYHRSRSRSPEKPAQVRREKRAAMRDEKGKSRDKPGSSSGEHVGISSGELHDLKQNEVRVMSTGKAVQEQRGPTENEEER